MGPQFFIKRPRFALVVSAIITLLGILAGLVMPVDQYPDITAPKVVVRAQYPGASAETVKEAIAAPIEDQVNGAEGMVYMSSKSASDGSYSLVVTFDISVDGSLAQVDVQNRVALAEPSLPLEVRQRGVTVRKRSPDILMMVNVISPDNRFDGVFLSNFASLNIQPELARVPGVGEASIIGQQDYGMRVWLDPIKLAERNLSVNQVLNAIREQNVQAAVGQLGAAPMPNETQFQYVLKTQGRLVSEEEFGNIILDSDQRGTRVRMRDVARIELGSEGYRGFGEFQNNPGVMLAIYKLSEANALETAEAVREKLAELKPYFPEGVDTVIGHDTTLFIEASLEETVLTLLFTIALVILVTYLFLGSARATLVPTVAVPVSIIGTLAVLFAVGMSINTVTLFALILSIGVVVDDAILVVENVERLMSDEGLDPKAATQKAMQQVAAPIVATSLVLVAVFAPTMLLPGITGEMFGQFGTTLVVSVLFSMINALSLSPALCVLVMKHGDHESHNFVIRGFNAGFDRITRGYVKLVTWLTQQLALSSALIVGLFIALYLMFSSTPSSFIPNEDKGFFFVDLQLPAGASLNRTSAAMDRVYESMQDDPAIEYLLAVNGYSLLNGALQSNAGMVIAKLKDWSEREDPAMHQSTLIAKYQRQLNSAGDGVAIVFGAPPIPGLGAVSGVSYVLEDTQARGATQMVDQVQTLLGDINARPEIARAFSTFRADYPQISLTVDRERAKTLGIAINDIFVTLQTQLGGYYVNDFNLFGQTYRVMVQADTPFRQQEQDLNNIYVANAAGELTPISALVETEIVQGADVLYRYNTYDSAVLNNIPAPGYSSGDVMAMLEDLSDQLLLPGYRYDWTDSSFEERKSGNAAPIALALSFVFTFLFLAALYESFLTPVGVLLSVPLAMVGAFIALNIAQEPLSLYGQIALVLLIGLAAKVAILIVEFAKELREVEGLSLDEATVKAATLRFRPVNMTALSFVVGVFPLVIATGAGSASRVSMGLAIFGGSIMSAVAGTLLVPVFFKLVQLLREKVHGGPTKAPE